MVLMDFEHALWSAFRALIGNGTFGSVILRGCAFHYAQALYRRVQSLELTVAFVKTPLVRDTVVSCMHLGYLPVEHVAPEFARLCLQCESSMLGSPTDKPLLDFLSYMENNWIEGRRFGIRDFNCHRSKHRTNNIAESYHSQLRKRNFQERLNTLYLVMKLWQEAQDIPGIMEDFVNGRGAKLKKKTSMLEHVLDVYWDQLKKGIITPAACLDGISSRKVVVQDPEFAKHYSRSHLE